MAGSRLRAWGFLAVVIAAQSATAEEIAPGVTYTLHHAPGPNRIHVVAIDRLHAEYKLKVGWPQKKRNFTSRMSTSAIAGQYDAPPGHDVLAATNGSFFGAVPDVVGWPIASDGEVVQRPNTNNDTFYFGPSRVAGVKSNIQHANGQIIFANGATAGLARYNSPADSINATAFTPQWDSSTRSGGGRVEVILSDVTYPMRSDKEVSGVVTAIRTGAASANNAIPPGGMVVWGGLDVQSAILGNTAVGDRWRLRFATDAPELSNADFAITGIGWILHNGQANTVNWAVRPDGFPSQRHPRTVLASSDTHLFLIVCDGRAPGVSVGMTFQEMADFLAGTLGAKEAINLDGGGSSTMVVNGTVANTPSDGSQRLVANAVMLVKQDTSTVFPVDDEFGPSGRLAGWDDKFSYAAVVPFTPASPGGDGHVLKVANRLGGVDTVRRGDFDDSDYSVEAGFYCAYRPEVAGDGFERVALFARDSGTGALGLATYGAGNCYAMIHDSDTGAVCPGKYVNGVFTGFLPADALVSASTGWRRFRIDCYGSKIRFRLDGALVASVVDTSFARGYFGIGHHEFFASDVNVQGTRTDNFRAFVDPWRGGIAGDLDVDGDVDLSDFGAFQICYTGNGNVQTDPVCAGAKLDGDGDVDDSDFAVFHSCLSGANVPAPQACGGAGS